MLVLERFSKLKKIDFGTEPKLRKLVLKKLPKLSNILSNGDENASKRYLLSPSMFKNFHNLKELDITDCGMEDRKDVYTPANGVEMSTEKVSFFSFFIFKNFSILFSYRSFKIMIKLHLHFLIF